MCRWHTDLDYGLRGRVPWRRLLGSTGLGVSTVLVLASLAELLYAFFFSGGNEQVPHGAQETIVWFAIPLGALGSSITGVRFSRHSLRGDTSIKPVVLCTLVSTTALIGWFALAAAFNDQVSGAPLVPAP